MEPEVTAPQPRSRGLCTLLAGIGFVVLIIGVTYFALLAVSARYGGQEARATAYVDLGRFLSGGRVWYKDARVYGGVALLLALASLLFGVSPLTRITIPVAAACYFLLVFRGEQLGKLIESWALKKG